MEPQSAWPPATLDKALDHSLKRWEALTHSLYDGAEPIDNNSVENQIRPRAWA